MSISYRTLKTLFDIVKDEHDPTNYPCTPSQIILRQLVDWNIIVRELEQLHLQGLVIFQQQGAHTQVYLTKQGVQFIQSNIAFDFGS